MSGDNVGALIDADKAVHEEMRQRYPDGPYQDGMYGTGMLLELGRLGFVVVPTSDWQRLLADTPSVEPLDELQAALWECYVQSGADTDGDSGPGAWIAGMGDAGFARAVVEAVKQLRTDYNEVLDTWRAPEALPTQASDSEKGAK